MELWGRNGRGYRTRHQDVDGIFLFLWLAMLCYVNFPQTVVCSVLQGCCLPGASQKLTLHHVQPNHWLWRHFQLCVWLSHSPHWNAIPQLAYWWILQPLFLLFQTMTMHQVLNCDWTKCCNKGYQKLQQTAVNSDWISWFPTSLNPWQ